MSIEFVSDRKPQGTISGPFRSWADQTRFRSIWGVVDGHVNHYTGQEVEDGIWSADGKAKISGAPVRKGDKFHDVRSGNSTYREYQVPKEAVEAWNKYEAKQGNDQVRHFTEATRQKALAAGFSDPKPELQIEHIDVTPADILAAQAAMPDEAPAPTKKGAMSDEARARLSEAAKARWAEKKKQTAVAA